MRPPSRCFPPPRVPCFGVACMQSRPTRRSAGDGLNPYCGVGRASTGARRRQALYSSTPTWCLFNGFLSVAGNAAAPECAQVSQTYFMALSVVFMACLARLFVCILHLGGRLLEVHGALLRTLLVRNRILLL